MEGLYILIDVVDFKVKVCSTVPCFIGALHKTGKAICVINVTYPHLNVQLTVVNMQFTGY